MADAEPCWTVLRAQDSDSLEALRQKQLRLKLIHEAYAARVAQAHMPLPPPRADQLQRLSLGTPVFQQQQQHLGALGPRSAAGPAHVPIALPLSGAQEQPAGALDGRRTGQEEQSPGPCRDDCGNGRTPPGPRSGAGPRDSPEGVLPSFNALQQQGEQQQLAPSVGLPDRSPMMEPRGASEAYERSPMQAGRPAADPGRHRYGDEEQQHGHARQGMSPVGPWLGEHGAAGGDGHGDVVLRTPLESDAVAREAGPAVAGQSNPWMSIKRSGRPAPMAGPGADLHRLLGQSAGGVAPGQDMRQATMGMFPIFKGGKPLRKPAKATPVSGWIERNGGQRAQQQQPTPRPAVQGLPSPLMLAQQQQPSPPTQMVQPQQRQQQQPRPANAPAGQAALPYPQLQLKPTSSTHHAQAAQPAQQQQQQQPEQPCRGADGPLLQGGGLSSMFMRSNGAGGCNRRSAAGGGAGPHGRQQHEHYGAVDAQGPDGDDEGVMMLDGAEIGPARVRPGAARHSGGGARVPDRHSGSTRPPLLLAQHQQPGPNATAGVGPQQQSNGVDAHNGSPMARGPHGAGPPGRADGDADDDATQLVAACHHQQPVRQQPQEGPWQAQEHQQLPNRQVHEQQQQQVEQQQIGEPAAPLGLGGRGVEDDGGQSQHDSHPGPLPPPPQHQQPQQQPIDVTPARAVGPPLPNAHAANAHAVVKAFAGPATGPHVPPPAPSQQPAGPRSQLEDCDVVPATPLSLHSAGNGQGGLLGAGAGMAGGGSVQQQQRRGASGTAAAAAGRRIIASADPARGAPAKEAVLQPVQLAMPLPAAVPAAAGGTCAAAVVSAAAAALPVAAAAADEPVVQHQAASGCGSSGPWDVRLPGNVLAVHAAIQLQRARSDAPSPGALDGLSRHHGDHAASCSAVSQDVASPSAATVVFLVEDDEAHQQRQPQPSRRLQLLVVTLALTGPQLHSTLALTCSELQGPGPPPEPANAVTLLQGRGGALLLLLAGGMAAAGLGCEPAGLEHRPHGGGAGLAARPCGVQVLRHTPAGWVQHRTLKPAAAAAAPYTLRCVTAAPLPCEGGGRPLQGQQHGAVGGCGWLVAAAGDNGHGHVWQVDDAGMGEVLSSAALPPAKYRQLQLNDISELHALPHMPGRLLGCSSDGCVVLWEAAEAAPRLLSVTRPTGATLRSLCPLSLPYAVAAALTQGGPGSSSWWCATAAAEQRSAQQQQQQLLPVAFLARLEPQHSAAGIQDQGADDHETCGRAGARGQVVPVILRGGALDVGRAIGAPSGTVSVDVEGCLGAVGGADGGVVVWDLAVGRVSACWQLKGPVRTVTIAGGMCAAACGDAAFVAKLPNAT